ncbi:MAG: InlB B-repeat-containing protein, partial [Peptococcaceae bacterium]|nr:InlB B-repeat-containing protein [Peptococcaceae bacterium]
GQPAGGEEDGQPAEGEEDGQPAEGEEDGQPAEGEEDGQPAEGEEDGQPAEGEEDGQPAEGEEDGQPAGGEEDGQPAEGEEDGQPAEGEEDGQPAEGEGQEETVVPDAGMVQRPLEEEVLYEEQTLQAGIGSVMVTVSGYLPKGATVSVIPVSGVEIAGVNVIAAYDINLFDQAGTKIQPDDTVSVKVTDSALAAREEVSVYHAVPVISPRVMAMSNMTAVAPASEIAASVAVEEKTIDFEASHFSIYVIGIPFVATYTFEVDETAVSTQYLKNGEYLQAPATPADRQNAKFIGWYIGEAPVDFSQSVTVNADTEITVEARFSSVCYVYFSDGGKILTTKEVVPGNTVDAGNVPYIPAPGQALSHWTTGLGGGDAFDFNTPITEDTILYAAAYDCRWVTFDSQGGSVMPLIPVANGGKVSAPLTAPVKSGYAFLRWSASVGGPAYNFNTPITADTTLYAVWSPQGNISYTVLYWQENANDTGYTYVESASRTGQAGNKANYLPKYYSNFTFSRADDVTIAGDGSTIVNVYYNRTTYTLTFKVWKGGGFFGQLVHD